MDVKIKLERNYHYRVIFVIVIETHKQLWRLVV